MGLVCRWEKAQGLRSWKGSGCCVLLILGPAPALAHVGQDPSPKVNYKASFQKYYFVHSFDRGFLVRVEFNLKQRKMTLMIDLLNRVESGR